MGISVTDTNKLATITPKGIMGGVAGIAAMNLAHGAICLFAVTTTLSEKERVIAASAGNSAGVTLPARDEFKVFTGYGKTPVATLAAWNALGSDALRDDAIILDDTEAPIGSIYLGRTASAGAVTGAKIWVKSAAATWTDLTL